FLMCAQELATAVQHGLEVVVLVVDNGMYGTIRMHQERTYPGRVIATDLHNPDFAALAEAYGATGETVTDTGELPAAPDPALAGGGPTLASFRPPLTGPLPPGARPWSSSGSTPRRSPPGLPCPPCGAAERRF